MVVSANSLTKSAALGTIDMNTKCTVSWVMLPGELDAKSDTLPRGSAIRLTKYIGQCLVNHIDMANPE